MSMNINDREYFCVHSLDPKKISANKIVP